MPYEFDRYINGELMAEGVTIERQDNLPDAMREAARIASRGPNGESPVLVLRAEALSRTGAVKVTEAMVEAGLEYYAEGGCGGLADYERREVVEAIIEAALKAAMEAGQ